MSGGGIRQWMNRRKGHGEVVGEDRMDSYDDMCPKCGEEEQTPDHVVFRCRKFRRVKDERGRREWTRENGMRSESGRVDDEGRSILERVDLMEAFFAGVHRQI